MRCLVLVALFVAGVAAVHPLQSLSQGSAMRFRAQAVAAAAATTEVDLGMRMTHQGYLLRRALQWSSIKPMAKAYAYATGKGDIPEAAEMGSDSDRDKYFETQLTRDGREKAVQRFIGEFVKYYDEIKSNKPKADAADEALYNILRLLFEESKTDPAYYVSHAADHGARVMVLAHNYLLNIKGTLKGLQKEILGTETALDPQGSDHNYLLLLMDLTHILHDCGYNGLPYGQSPKLKWTHAVNGAYLIKKRLETPLKAILKDNKHFDIIFSAVRNHNMDNKVAGSTKNPASNYDQKGLPYPSDVKDGPLNAASSPQNPDPTTFPAGAMGVVPADQIAGEVVRTYVPAKLGDKTMLWLLRFADNMDASKARLTAQQQNAKLEKCWARLYGDETIRKARADKKDTEAATAIATIKDTYPACTDPEVKPDEFVKIKQIDERGFPHFYSNYVVEKTSLTATANAETVTFKVKFLQDRDLPVAAFPEVALYQINRMAEALASLTFGDDSSVIGKVDVELEGHPLATKKYKLAAFNVDTAKAAGLCADYNTFHQKETQCYAKPDAGTAASTCTSFYPDFSKSCT